MDKTAYKYYLLSRALEYQSKAAHDLMTNNDAPVYDSEWAAEEIETFKKYEKEVHDLKEELKLIDTSIPF